MPSAFVSYRDNYLHKPKVTRDRNLEARLELVSQHLGGEEVGVGCWQVAIIPVTKVAAKVGPIV